MADFYENKQVTEEVILVGVALGETSVTDESLDELEELAKTAGAVTVGRLIQNDDSSGDLSRQGQAGGIGIPHLRDPCNRYYL